MKISLIIFLLASTLAVAAEKTDDKVDMRQGTKAVDEKYLDDLSGTKVPEHKPVQASGDRSHQMDSKKSRQFQEERPVEAIKRQR